MASPAEAEVKAKFPRDSLPGEFRRRPGKRESEMERASVSSMSHKLQIDRKRGRKEERKEGGLFDSS